MKRLWTIILFTFISTLIWGQTVTDLKITPSSPTIDDSIMIDFKVIFLNTGAQKQNGSFTIGNDSVLYTGCYFKPSLNQGYSEVPDTIYLGKLPAGHYDLLLFQNIVFSVFDTTCINVAYSDTVDTFFVVTEPSGIADGANEDMVVWPNPVTDCINLHMPSHNNASLAVSSMDGKIIIPAISLVDNQNKIDISFLSSGIYLLTVTDGERRYVKRFIKL